MNDLEIHPRELLGGALAVTALATLPAPVEASSADRTTVGEFEITAHSDGFISLPGEILVPDAMPANRAAVLGCVDAPDGVVHAQCNIPLIRRDDDLTLVDIGWGRQILGDRRPALLQAAGLDPAAITKVVFTRPSPPTRAALRRLEALLKHARVISGQ